MSVKTIRSSLDLQPNYRYTLTEPLGKEFDPLFKPELTPQEMLALGVFDGYYYNQSWQAEFPQDWFKSAHLSTTNQPDSSKNFFGIHASQPLSVWQAKHWIAEQDPLGWFQWYCRYYFGRRGADDQRQIKRHRAIKRHASQVALHCETGDFNCRPKQRQALLHWAYDSRKI